MESNSFPAEFAIARQERITWLIWAGFCLAAVALLLWGPKRSPVNESYAFGAACWENRTLLYNDAGCGFIYPPQAAILHWPLLKLPHSLYEFAWRGVNIGLLAAGVCRMAACSGGRFDAPLSTFLITTLVTVPKAWTLALNGQATMAMTGLTLVAAADVAERRWWRATLALLLALAFKPLAIVLLLLAAGLFRPMLWRLAVGGLVFFVIPYLTRDAEYVTSQYLAFVENLNAASAIGQDMAYPGLFSLMHMLGFHVPVAGQTAMQIVAALTTLGTGWIVTRRLSSSHTGLLLYSLATCYLLLFNPRTENNSYTMLMPAVALFGARARLVEKRWPRVLLLAGIIAALTGGFEATRVLTPRAIIVWPCPVACLLFVGFLVLEIVRLPAEISSRSMSHAPEPARTGNRPDCARPRLPSLDCQAA